MSLSGWALGIKVIVIDAFSYSHLPNHFILHLVHLQKPLWPISIKLFLQNSLHLLFDFLLIDFGKLLLFHLKLFVSRRLNFSNLESNSTNLDDVAFH